MLADFCGAHAAVEVFEARARLLNARVNMPFPTLSILHLIDQLRDASANATTAADRRRVASEGTPFELLKMNGVVSKEDYDAAPAGEGFTRNVQVIYCLPLVNCCLFMLLQLIVLIGYLDCTDVGAETLQDTGLSSMLHQA